MNPTQEATANSDVTEELLDLLRLCTVRILLPNGSSGTGFFVAKQTVVTCLHVVEGFEENASEISIEWHGQPYKASSVELPTDAQQVRVKTAPDQADDDRYGMAMGSDLALLTIPLDDHPCVFLDTAVALHNPLYSYGYPEGYPHGDPVTTTFEGFSPDPLLLKFKQGQIRPGLSGSPILNLRTGAVCGLITKTRGEMTDLGGRGVPTSTILSTFAALRKQNVSFHNNNIQWLQAISPSQRRTLQRRQGIGDGEALLLPAGDTGLARALLGITVASFSDGEQSTQVKPYGDWRLVGPAGAFVQALEIDPHENRALYVALENGQGVFRSDDAGRTWLPKDLGLGSRNVTDLAISPHDGALYAATRKGLWVSYDRGDTWVPGHERFKNLELLCVIVSEHDPNLLIVGSRKQGGGGDFSRYSSCSGIARSIIQERVCL